MNAMPHSRSLSQFTAGCPNEPTPAARAGRSKPKGTVTDVGEKVRIAWEPFTRK
jgi:hypothetical protein